MLRFAPAATGLVIEIDRARLDLNLLADQVACGIVLRSPPPDQMPKRDRSLKVADGLAVLDLIGEIKLKGFRVDRPPRLRILHQHAGLRMRQAIADSGLNDRAVLLRRLKGRAASAALRRLGSARRLGLGGRRGFFLAASHAAYLPGLRSFSRSGRSARPAAWVAAL